ncbi:hypothetical protein JZ751_011545, partial [Albula glossodonta]
MRRVKPQMDEQVETDMPLFDEGNSRGQIVTSSHIPSSWSTPYLSHRSCESGYTRVSRDPLAGPDSPPPEPQAHVPNVGMVGKKELSGFVHNMPTIETLGEGWDDPRRFRTSYNSNFGRAAGSAMTEAGTRPVILGLGTALPQPGRHPLQESGYARGTRSSPAWNIPLTSGPDTRSPNTSSLTNQQIIGRKESSGFVSNMPNIQSLGTPWVDPRQFLTHYQSTAGSAPVPVTRWLRLGSSPSHQGNRAWLQSQSPGGSGLAPVLVTGGLGLGSSPGHWGAWVQSRSLRGSGLAPVPVTGGLGSSPGYWGAPAEVQSQSLPCSSEGVSQPGRVLIESGIAQYQDPAVEGDAEGQVEGRQQQQGPEALQQQGHQPHLEHLILRHPLLDSHEQHQLNDGRSSKQLAEGVDEKVKGQQGQLD